MSHSSKIYVYTHWQLPTRGTHSLTRQFYFGQTSTVCTFPVLPVFPWAERENGEAMLCLLLQQLNFLCGSALIIDCIHAAQSRHTFKEKQPRISPQSITLKLQQSLFKGYQSQNELLILLKHKNRKEGPRLFRLLLCFSGLEWVGYSLNRLK